MTYLAAMMKVFQLLLITTSTKVVLSDSVIGNGKVILGVSDYANLNVPFVGDVLGLPPFDPIGLGYIGLRNGDGDAGAYAATEPGCLCEGWGAGVKTSGEFTSTCGSDVAVGGVGAGMTLLSSSGVNGGSTATSEVTCGIPDMVVTHEFQPSASPDLMEAVVTVKNVGLSNFEEVHYRRAMDWDIYPSPFQEYVTHIGVSTTSSLVFSNDNGFCDPNPASSCSEIYFGTTNVDFEDSGPTDHGSAFQFNLGPLNAGQSLSFKIFYGSSLGEVAALAAVGTVEAELVSLGQQKDSPLEGNPYTFIFGFSGVYGIPIFTAQPSASPSAAPTPAPLFKWILVNAYADVDWSVIKMDQVFSFSTIGSTKLSARLETPATTKKVVFTWKDDRGRINTNTEINSPFYMGRNNRTDAFPVRYLGTPGTKIVNATMKDVSGNIIATSTIRFVMVA
jgi:hypothetical protein